MYALPVLPIPASHLFPAQASTIACVEPAAYQEALHCLTLVGAATRINQHTCLSVCVFTAEQALPYSVCVRKWLN